MSPAILPPDPMGAGAWLNWVPRYFSGRHLSGVALIALFSGMIAFSPPVLSATGTETFGPGKVACERLDAGQVDCLLTALSISGSDNGVATFDLDTLPATERAIFQTWCTTAADDCTVQVQGTRLAPGSSRIVGRDLGPLDMAHAAQGPGSGQGFRALNP